MFDIDGNGIVDPGEEYLAFRIWGARETVPRWGIR